MPSGWDAELYRNGELLAFSRSDGSQRYIFDEVPLLYGDNRFEIVTYGPQGQQRSRLEHINVGQEQVPEGKTWYWAGVSQPGKDLLGDFVEPRLIQPTIIMNYPQDISPLAKGVPGDPLHVERFEFFIGGIEMGNAFTELNDPIEQRKRFEELQVLFARDDDELNPIDEDYLRAMRYGMPPNGGFGLGVDRLVMLLTDNRTVREVLLFPHLRQREE